MKKKKESKLSIEKVTVAHFTSLKNIKGGDSSNVCTTTETVFSTRECDRKGNISKNC